VKQTLLESK